MKTFGYLIYMQIKVLITNKNYNFVQKFFLHIYNMIQIHI